MKIIIVDDNIQFRESLSFFLEVKLGYEVEGCFDSAIPLTQEGWHSNADIILMDIEMPDLNGIEATKTILRHNHFRKIIAVTNHQEKAYLEDLIGAGFKGCVFKNNIFDELSKALTTVKNNRFYYPRDIAINH